jgi:hypothetical protein
VAQCIFCPNEAGSPEHIFAKWISLQLEQDPRGFPRPVKAHLRDVGGAVKEIPGGPYVEFVTETVCTTCNTGWMGLIENKASEFMKPLLADKPCRLSKRAQRTIALWACKTFVVARFAHIQPDHVEEDWTRWLYEKRSPIHGWYVWLGRYVGSWPLWYGAHDIRLNLLPGQNAPADIVVPAHGVMATIAIGYLTVQILGLGGELPGADDESCALRIWPPTGNVVDWPPSIYIEDASLPIYADRLLFKGDVDCYAKDLSPRPSVP